jgi:hypothetical protein
MLWSADQLDHRRHRVRCVRAQFLPDSGQGESAVAALRQNAVARERAHEPEGGTRIRPDLAGDLLGTEWSGGKHVGDASFVATYIAWESHAPWAISSSATLGGTAERWSRPNPARMRPMPLIS